jgi:peptidyl-prolyl cis-trans isomerase C
MTTATEVKASHILVADKEACEQLRAEIVGGTLTFEDAAKQHSKCPSGANGGDLGFFGRGRMVPQFDKVAFDLPVGEISEAVQTQFGWHLLVVTDAR